ncbi:hypothetical protein R1flu_011404 [Riccia fluitans]|uniref:Uncharacterized protein n=1 Tax=Riccia fluitans TaxID=41844 RepID=A0ABD1ZBY0_9MARC
MVSIPDYSPLKRNKYEEQEQAAQSMRTRWTDSERIRMEMRHIAAERASKAAVDGFKYVTPTIIRLPHNIRSVRPDLFMYNHIDMPLGLYNRGDLRVTTESERRRIDAVLTFMKKVNERRPEEKQLEWDELSMRVVPDPAQAKLLYEDPPELTEEEVRYLLTIDAVYLLCLFQGLVLFQGHEHRYSEIPALSRKEIYILKKKGTLQDVLLLENQVPLFLIQNALAVTMDGNDGDSVASANIGPAATDSGSESKASYVFSQDVDRHGIFQEDKPTGSVKLAHNLDGERALRLDLGKLLTRVLPSFLGVCGLPSFSDHSVSKLQLASSDHLLECVYKVVCSRSAGLRTLDRHVSHSDHESASIRVEDRSKEQFVSQSCFHKFLSSILQLQSSTKFSLDPHLKDLEGAFVSRARVVPTASQLKKVGIRIRGSGAGTIFDYKLEQGLFKDTLYIPKLELWRCSLEMFRNLALLEMRPGKLYEDQPVIEYLTLMSQLVHTMDDVILLSECKDPVVMNTLGDVGVVVDLCNHVIQGTTSQQTSPQFQNLCVDVRQRYNNRKQRAFWEFVETYLNKAWKVGALLAIVLLLVLTLIQTVYAR